MSQVRLSFKSFQPYNDKGLIMFQWKNASSGDLKRFQIIEEIFKDYPRLLEFLFHTTKAELRSSPEVIRQEAGCLSSGERLLIRIAMDIWSESGDVKLLDILSLDFKLYERVVFAITRIR